MKHDLPLPSPLRPGADGHLHATLTDLRTMMHDVVSRVAVTGDRVYLERHGKIVAVLVHPEDLRILESIEDARDVKVSADAMTTVAREGTVPHAEVVARPKASPGVEPVNRLPKRGPGREQRVTDRYKKAGATVWRAVRVKVAKKKRPAGR